jgi:hypothetical protein
MRKAAIFCFVISLFFVSCNEKHTDLPPFSILSQTLPSQNDGLLFNLIIPKKNVPHNLEIIYQTLKSDTVNILQYDKNKNLIFKYYRNYFGEIKKSNSLIMSEGNVYSGNKLVRTFYFHSNIGFQEIEYKYDGSNITDVKSYYKGCNLKQCAKNQKIKSYQEMMQVVERIDLKHNGVCNFSIKRVFNGDEIKEFFESIETKKVSDSTYILYKVNDNRKLLRTEWIANGKKSDKDTKYFLYGKDGKLKKKFSLNSKSDTTKSTEYIYKNQRKIRIRKENYFEINRNEYYKNQLIKEIYNYRDEKYPYIFIQEMDKMGFPLKIKTNVRNTETIYLLKNSYIFF